MSDVNDMQNIIYIYDMHKMLQNMPNECHLANEFQPMKALDVSMPRPTSHSAAASTPRAVQLGPPLPAQDNRNQTSSRTSLLKARL